MNGEGKKEIIVNNAVTQEEENTNKPVLDISKYSIRTPGGYLDKEERNAKDELITLKV